MNAFQFGVATYKWDAKKNSYICRPFNFYIMQHSEILGDPVLQFKASNIKFLTKHGFDFNKLFTSGITFQRLSDKQMVRDKIEQKTDLALLGGIGLTQGNQVSYHPNRAFTSLGCQSQKSLQDYLRKVANFIQLARQTDDQLVLDLKIDSYALRRKLSQELFVLYKDRNIIFTQFSKNSPIFSIRKWKAKNEGDDKDSIKQEVKVTEQETE